MARHLHNYFEAHNTYYATYRKKEILSSAEYSAFPADLEGETKFAEELLQLKLRDITTILEQVQLEKVNRAISSTKELFQEESLCLSELAILQERLDSLVADLAVLEGPCA